MIARLLYSQKFFVMKINILVLIGCYVLYGILDQSVFIFGKSKSVELIGFLGNLSDGRQRFVSS